MEKIAIAKFKATWLRVWEKVRKTGKPVLVTRFGQPVEGDFAAGHGAETSAQIPCACRYPGVLSSSKNELWLSAVSMCEVAVLFRKKRISLPKQFHSWLQESAQAL